MTFERASGVLLHPTSLPGPHGIGDVGDAAFRFVEWLRAAGQRCWQIMPLVPVGYGNSPYSSVSAFAGNPLLISLPWLVGDGLLDESDLADAPAFAADRVDYDAVEEFKQRKLRRAFDRYRAGAAAHLRPALAAFVIENGSWVRDYALFMAAKRHFKGVAWPEWDSGLAFRESEQLKSWRARLAPDVAYYEFEQYLFRRQWSELKRHANENGVRIIGDIPIFVAHDSADVWANQRHFRLDAEGQPSVVAGVPPDYFSATGQRWGNPHYDWAALEEEQYAWWVERFRSLLQLVDVVRVDHFRGFAAAWAVPADSETAAGGRWERGPGARLFDAIRQQLGDVPVIAEDLGLITPDVRELRREAGFPGMAVLQFAFDGDPDNAYLPHNYSERVVVYSGTHDNQTTIGWFHGVDERTRREVQNYLGKDGSDIAWDLVRLALASTAELAISPLQDILRLGDEARMNVPGIESGNWSWRFTPDELGPDLAGGLAALTDAYGRGIKPAKPADAVDPYDYTAAGTEHPLYG